MENLNIIILSSIISGLISFLITIFTLYIKDKIEKNKIITKYVEELYKKRLENYPSLIDITQNIGKTVDSYNESKKALEIIKKGKNSLLYSEETFKYYNELKEELKRIPEIKGKIYSKEQRNKIWKARNKFRPGLRNDIGLGHKFNKWN